MDDRNPVEPGRPGPERESRDSSTQTGSKVQGPGPRLSQINLFTLLSLWLELFPQEESEQDDHNRVRGMGLVVVRDSKVMGLHCSGPELHAGQAAIIQHGSRLADCQMFFSRRPCATCLKMIINAGVSQISFWPGDPEVSMLRSSAPHHCNSHSPDCTAEEAVLDAMATEKLKSNSCVHVCVLLQPLQPGLEQFVAETSRECDFMEIVTDDGSGLSTEEMFNRERLTHLKNFSKHFLVETSQQHRDILAKMGLENFCVEPYFSDLRHNMRALVGVLAAVAAAVPQRHYGFHREESSAAEPPPSPRHDDVSPEVARHCIIQARLLSYRTEDPKVGVGAVIWARGCSTGCEGTGDLYLLGCGYNAYPAGSHHAEYPQMDSKQEDRHRCKYRYIVHAEQNALTFRTRDVRPEDTTMLFVTKCPCDECVPLIRGAGITHIYTSDLDRDKDKRDISYLRFSSLKGVSKFIWQRSPPVPSATSPHHFPSNCFMGKHSRQPEQDLHGNKRMCPNRSHVSSPVS